MDASRWSGGRGCCDSQIPHDGRTSRRAPTRGNHRRRADDARTRPVVDRRPALRMEAHRRTSAQEVVRASAEPGTPRPKGSPASHPTSVVSRNQSPLSRVWAHERARTASGSALPVGMRGRKSQSPATVNPTATAGPTIPTADSSGSSGDVLPSTLERGRWGGLSTAWSSRVPGRACTRTASVLTRCLACIPPDRCVDAQCGRGCRWHAGCGSRVRDSNRFQFSRRAGNRVRRSSYRGSHSAKARLRPHRGDPSTRSASAR